MKLQSDLVAIQRVKARGKPVLDAPRIFLDSRPESIPIRLPVPLTSSIYPSIHRHLAAMGQDDDNNREVFKALDHLEAFKLQGRDKRGRRILRIVGRFLPARALREEVLRRYLQERILPELLGRFCVVYVHTGAENFRGVSVLRSVYESLPGELEAIYFVHPGLQARLFLATLGRFLFGAGLYGKVKYIGRLVYLWEHMRRGEIEIPEFVIDHDEELEHRPFMDYGIESDHHRIHDASVVDYAASMYSLRCIS